METRTTPPTTELFSKLQLAARHPHLLTETRIAWACRNRYRNGLAAAGAVFEARGSELLVHEPAFLRWFLGLTGRAKPRKLRRRERS
jgi:hypothetical protein